MGDAIRKPKVNKLRGAIMNILCSDDFVGANLMGKADILEQHFTLRKEKKTKLTIVHGTGDTDKNMIVWKDMVDCWMKWYTEQKGTAPNFTNGEPAALKRLQEKIRLKVVEGKHDWNNDMAIACFQAFFNSIKDRWTLDHLKLSIIDNNFDILYANAKQRSKGSGITNADAANMDVKIEERFGVKQSGSVPD